MQKFFQKQLLAPCDGKPPYTEPGWCLGGWIQLLAAGLAGQIVPFCAFASLCADLPQPPFKGAVAGQLFPLLSPNLRTATHTLMHIIRRGVLHSEPKLSKSLRRGLTGVLRGVEYGWALFPVCRWETWGQGRSPSAGT